MIESVILAAEAASEPTVVTPFEEALLGGLVFATTLTLFLIPVLYNLLARFARSSNAVAIELDRQARDTAGSRGITSAPQSRHEDRF